MSGLRDLRQEDEYISQLEEAADELDRLQAEKDSLEKENTDLQAEKEKLQKQLDHLTAQHQEDEKEKSEAQRMVSKLSSAVSEMKSELQKKSDRIVQLSRADQILKENARLKQERDETVEQANAALRKAERKAGRCKQEYEEKMQTLAEKERKLDEDRQRVSDMKTGLAKEISEKAEALVSGELERLQWTGRVRQAKLEGDFRRKRNGMYGGYVLSLIYGIAVTIFEAMESQAVRGEVIEFANLICKAVLWVLGLAERAWYAILPLQLRFPNRTAGVIAATCLAAAAAALICGGLFGIPAVLIWKAASGAGEYFKSLKTLYLSAFSLAILVWFADPIRSMIPVNLVLLWVILQAAGFIIEAIRRHRRDKQRYGL